MKLINLKKIFPLLKDLQWKEYQIKEIEFSRKKLKLKFLLFLKKEMKKEKFFKKNGDFFN
jgi:hypothetical protein